MKKIVVLFLLLCMILSLAACGKVEISMQEIYDASQTESLLKNHENVYIRNEMDGEIWAETYLTKGCAYEYIPGAESSFAQFMTDNVKYTYSNGDYLRYLFITPDGVGDFASDRAEHYASVILGEEALGDIIESVSKKDGRITVKSLLGEEFLTADDGLTSGKTEYVLDAKTHELISVITDYTYEDGTVFQVGTEVTYDAEVPEALKEFLAYENQTENLRNITVVSNPGTEKEVSQSFQIPKGLIIGFTWDDAFTDKVEICSNAACTEAYDPYADTESDLTIYIKWAM